MTGMKIAKQNSDGSFGSLNEDKYKIILETLKAIITFTSSNSDISMYRNQIKKSSDYLISSESSIFKNENLTRLAYIALELCKARNILKDSNLKAVLVLSNKLKDCLHKDKKNEELLTIVQNLDINKIKVFLQDFLKMSI